MSSIDSSHSDQGPEVGCAYAVSQSDPVGVGAMARQLCSQRPLLGLCSAAAVLKFLMIFEQKTHNSIVHAVVQTMQSPGETCLGLGFLACEMG